MENKVARLIVLKNMFDNLDEEMSELFYEHPYSEVLDAGIDVKGDIDTPLAVSMAQFSAFIMLDRGLGDGYREFVHLHNSFVKDTVTYKYFDELFNAAFVGVDNLLAHATLDKMLIDSFDKEFVMMDKLDVFVELWESAVEYYGDLFDIADIAESILNME